MARDKLNRRGVLRSIGAAASSVAVAGLGAAQRGSDDEGSPPGTAGTDNDRQLPITADGRLVVEYTEDRDAEDRYVLDPTFYSPDLNKRYGSPTFEYKPLELPAELVPEGVKKGERSKYVVRTQRVIGTPAEHRQAEREIRKQRAGDDGVRPFHTPVIDGNVPLYSYASESDASGGDKQDRTSPMNVAWESKQSQDIQQKMEGGVNGPVWLNITSPFPQVDLHVNLPNGGTKSTDKHVMKHITDLTCPTQTKQYHIRLYDVPFSEIAAVGQAHRDPCYHGKIPEVPILNPDPETNWKLDEAKNKVVDFWEEGHSLHADTPHVGNTSDDYASHDGSWAYFDTDANI